MSVRDTIARIQADPTNDHKRDVTMTNQEFRDIVNELEYGQSFYEDIHDFHDKFGLAYSGPPRLLDVDLATFRTKFMFEELFEYLGYDDEDVKLLQGAIERFIVKHGAPPLEQQLDALVDLVYVALGTAHMHGFDFDEAWRRVHAANMKKVKALRDGSDSKRGSGFDVVKPQGWQPADLSDLVTPEGSLT